MRCDGWADIHMKFLAGEKPMVSLVLVRSRGHGDGRDGSESGAVVTDAECYRRKAQECAEQIEHEQSDGVRDHLKRLRNSYLLLARNAEWLADTDSFLRGQYRKMLSREEPRSGRSRIVSGGGGHGGVTTSRPQV